MKKSLLSRISLSALLPALPLSAQQIPPEKPHLDKILERRPFAPAEAAALDLTGGAGGAADGKVDVRDLVVFLNNQPISASFGSKETLAFHSAGSVTLPIYFSKPVTGTIRLDLAGNAEEGIGKDYTITPAGAIPVSGAATTQVTVSFPPWRGVGGEKVIRLSINRNTATIPANGTFSSHVLRVRQFEAGEFVGTLSFKGGSGLPSVPVRIGLSQTGSAVISFQRDSTLFGSKLDANWQPGHLEFPHFPESIELQIPGKKLARTTAVKSSIRIQRLAAPFDPQNAAYLEGFPANDQPALYDVSLSMHNLLAAGTETQNPYTVTHHGRLAVQRVSYLQDQP